MNYKKKTFTQNKLPKGCMFDTIKPHSSERMQASVKAALPSPTLHIVRGERTSTNCSRCCGKESLPLSPHYFLSTPLSTSVKDYACPEVHRGRVPLPVNRSERQRHNDKQPSGRREHNVISYMPGTVNVSKEPQDPTSEPLRRRH